jgi:membrane protease YdiL (CAAX protease family)
VDTPLRPLPQDSFAEFTTEPAAPVAVVDPDDPPWGVGMAILVWLVSILSIIFIPLLALVPYFVIRIKGGANIQEVGQSIATDPTALLITLVATIPAHALTLFAIWAVVTRLGKRPFWQTIGWSWNGRFGLRWSVATAFLLLLAGYLLTYFFGGEKTPFDQMLESSAAARFTTAALATLSAPLVEELVFRGIIYAPLQRALARAITLLKTLTARPPVSASDGEGATGGAAGFLFALPLRAMQSVLTFFGALDAKQGGMAWAVILVSMLFLSVHIPQYQNNLAVIVAVGMLSVALTGVRALTGRVLPCFIIHLVFNGVQVAILIYEYFQPGKPAGDVKTGLIVLGQQLSALSFFHF